MANIYAYIEAGYAVFANAANEIQNIIAATELAIARDPENNVYFIHKRDPIAFSVASMMPVAVAPTHIAAAQPNEILNKAGVQYTGTTSFEDFWAAWVLANPTYTNEATIDIDARLSATLTPTHTTRTTASAFETPVGARTVRLIALAGASFTVGGVSYPVTTANGVIDEFAAGNGINPLAAITYTVVTPNVLQIIEA